MLYNQATLPAPGNAHLRLQGAPISPLRTYPDIIDLRILMWAASIHSITSIAIETEHAEHIREVIIDSPLVGSTSTTTQLFTMGVSTSHSMIQGEKVECRFITAGAEGSIALRVVTEDS